MKLSKSQIKSHNQVIDLVKSDKPLTEEQKIFILDNYQESATNVNSQVGAFFTPRGLARDFAIEVSGGSCIDLCAGIGALSFAVEEKVDSLVCIEQNYDYYEIGKKIVPNATWIHASVFDELQLTNFDIAISNPPFGNIKADGFIGKYTGPSFEYKVMELASRIANYGVFIIPQMSASFRYSGQRNYKEEASDKCLKFIEQTNIIMSPSCGIDTAYYLEDWHGVSPMCEIVCCDFEDIQHNQKDLFS